MEFHDGPVGRVEQPVDLRVGSTAEGVDDTPGDIRALLAGLRACTELNYERLDQGLHAVSGGIARLERKLDRILAIVVESRARR